MSTALSTSPHFLQHLMPAPAASPFSKLTRNEDIPTELSSNIVCQYLINDPLAPCENYQE
eukprot:1441562-Amphidinium_carterae.1